MSTTSKISIGVAGLRSAALIGPGLVETAATPVTSVFSPASGTLLVRGNSLDNAIDVSRNAAGAVLVNGGAVPVLGGTPTVANTSVIQVFGQAGNDVITLNEANGALPRALLFGGAGNDILTGGSGADLIFGQADNDTLIGRGGNDLLFGGSGNDVLVGGDADDQMFGEAGDDRLIWNPGDDTDLFEGGAGNDTAEVNGGGGGEVFTLTANGTRVRFDRVSPAPFSIDAGTIENFVVNMNGGDDTFSATGNLAALTRITVDGGAGNDTILGSNGIDLLLGGDGNDFIDGQQGNDVAFLGAGDDIFQWDPGDGSDVVEGQAGTDTLLFNGSAGNEIMELVANGARTRLTRNLGNIVMDNDDVERFEINAFGGADTINVGDLSGTDATHVTVNLAGTIGGASGDAQADTVITNGSNASQTIDVAGQGGTFTVLGSTARLDLRGVEATDTLVVNGLAGDDLIDASTVQAGEIKLTLDGGAGDDTLRGSRGVDVLLGGDGDDFVDGQWGNDVALLGAGDDVFQWDPGDGSDTLEGQDGRDTMRFNGSNAAENIDIAANGGRVIFFRDVASITMDLNDMEVIDFNALGGADNIVVGNLTGTDVQAIGIDLAATLGGQAGDGQVDRITANGTTGTDLITVSNPGGLLRIAGLPATVNIEHAEGADRLIINAGGGDDVLDASVLPAGGITLELQGGLGSDVFFGSQGNDLILGGDGNDVALMGAGDDTFVWNPGDDNDTLEGQAGTDTMLFNGANVSESIDIVANGGRAIFFRNVASVAMDLNDTEIIDFNALGGADTIRVGDLSGTDVTEVRLDLAATGGTTGDAQADTVIIDATSGDDVVSVSMQGNSLVVSGLSARVVIDHFEAGLDRLMISGLAGDDVIDASALALAGPGVTVDAGAGNDIVLGGAGNDVLSGGDGDDVILGGAGDDLIDGGAGDDVLLGEAGNDTISNGEIVIQSLAGAGGLFA